MYRNTSLPSLCTLVFMQLDGSTGILGQRCLVHVHISLVHSPTCLVHSFVYTSLDIPLRLKCTHTHTPAWVGIVLSLLPPVYVTSYTSSYTINKGLDLLTCCGPSLVASPPATFPSPSQTSLLGEDTQSVLWSGDKELEALFSLEPDTNSQRADFCWAGNLGGGIIHIALHLSTILPLALAAPSWKSGHQEMSNPPREGEDEHETRNREMIDFRAVSPRGLKWSPSPSWFMWTSGSQLVSHTGHSEYVHRFHLSHVLPFCRFYYEQIFLIFPPSYNKH